MSKGKMAMRQPVIWLLLLALVLVPCASWSAESPSDGEAASLYHRERPEDPPGQPARPVPGAPRSAPVAQGSFVSIQANVGPFGTNIVGDAANEPSIALDPNNPNHMAIGWRQFSTVTSNFREAGWAFTIDGGRTWTFPGVLEPGVFRSDPVLGFDAVGNFYYNSLKVVGNNFTCDVFKSTNRGAWWGSAVFAHGGDKQWMTIDRTGGIGDGHIYCAWSTAAGCCGNQTFTRSTDGGQSFSIPTGIPFTPIWGTMDVAADGTLYIGGIDPNSPSTFYVTKSTNAQDPLATPIFNTQLLNMGGAVVFSGGTPSPNPIGLLGQVWIAVDKSSGPRAGYLYALCSVDPLGTDPLDVHFTRSTNGGLSWSSPVRVNDDVGDAWQWFGTMSVAPNGRIDAIWNDTRNSVVANQSELHYASSSDGGVTWSANQKLSPMWNSHVGWPNQDKIGDYYGMISDDVGAHVAWAATFNNEQDVYYLRINDYDCNSNGVGDSLDIALGTSPDNDQNGIPDECAGIATASGDIATPYRLHQNVPNPFNPTTTIRFDVPAGGGQVRLQVFDVTGRLVRTLVDDFVRPGGRSVLWDGRDHRGETVATGLYLYRLDAPGFTETRKMLFLK
jgi:hypothetical protein